MRSQLILSGSLLAITCSSPAVLANPVDTGYQQPPQEIIDIVDAPSAPGASLSPDGSQLILSHYPALPVLADLAAPEYRLAGRRINPDNQTVSQSRYIEDFTLIDTSDGSSRSISGLPEDLRATSITWSPDGQSVAFYHLDPAAAELWHLDVANGIAERWSDVTANLVWGGQIAWTADSDSVIIPAVVADRGAEPEPAVVPTGPNVNESRGRSAPARTYQDLLGDSHDEALFDYYFTSQLTRINRAGEQETLGEPGVINNYSLSPNNDYLLVTQLDRPYSYAVPHFRFARTTAVWNDMGEPLHTVVEQPVADDLPISFDAVVDGRRNVHWRNDAPATLVWAEAADGGDPRTDAEVRDRLYQQPAPFSAEPDLLAELGYRYSRMLAADGETALIWERWWADRGERVWRLSPDGDQEPELLWERAWEDRYNDPGSPLTTRAATGKRLLLVEDGHIFLTGDGASDEGDRPFIDQLELASGDTERLWRSESPYFEQPRGVIDLTDRVFLTQRESVDQPADFYRRSLGDDNLTALTETEHPMPHTQGISRELIHYEREDELAMSATLFLPEGYDPEVDDPLPTIIWAYPREYRSTEAAAQVSGSPYEFNRISYWRPQYLATQGYAVLDNATMPIVGEGDKQPNDTFIEQLVMNSAAAIAAGVERGVTDPDRVALGGHSYGAFMTANVLAHSDLFQAGIARSGAYNRTLTPFGFQREERTVWDAPELYLEMSPFFAADELATPLLLIHGEEDNNSGTYPMQSERFYQAVRGLGGTTRLVMLPLESHGYRARESVLHMLWEQQAWLDEFVKNAE